LEILAFICLTLKLYDTDFHFALIGEPIIVNELFFY